MASVNSLTTKEVFDLVRADLQKVPQMVSAVSKTSKMNIIVGGGIRTPSQARTLVDAGAKIIVTGTIAEKASVRKLRGIIRALH